MSETSLRKNAWMVIIEHGISPTLPLDGLPVSVSNEKTAKGPFAKEQKPMKSAAGLWIDHRQASIVMLSAGGERTEHITSDIEKDVRFSGGSRFDGPGTSLEEDQQDRRFGNQLSQYYDKVITVVREADAILIFGPGEAKGELQQRFEREGLGGRIIGVETADKMTDRQIAAKVRQYFGKIRGQKPLA